MFWWFKYLIVVDESIDTWLLFSMCHSMSSKINWMFRFYMSNWNSSSVAWEKHPYINPSSKIFIVVFLVMGFYWAFRFVYVTGNKDIICTEDLIHEIFTVGNKFKYASNFLWPFKVCLCFHQIFIINDIGIVVEITIF